MSRAPVSITPQHTPSAAIRSSHLYLYLYLIGLCGRILFSASPRLFRKAIKSRRLAKGRPSMYVQPTEGQSHDRHHQMGIPLITMSDRPPRNHGGSGQFKYPQHVGVSLGRVPADVLVGVVFPFLTTSSLLLRVRLVCRHWFALSSTAPQMGGGSGIRRALAVAAHGDDNRAHSSQHSIPTAAVHRRHTKVPPRSNSQLAALVASPHLTRVELAMPALMLAVGFDAVTSKLYVVTRGDGGGGRGGSSGGVGGAAIGGAIPEDIEFLLFEHDFEGATTKANDAAVQPPFRSQVAEVAGTSTYHTSSSSPSTVASPRPLLFPDRPQDRRMHVIPYDLGHMESAAFRGPFLVCTAIGGDLFVYDCRNRRTVLLPTGTSHLTASPSGDVIAATVHEDVCLVEFGDEIVHQRHPPSALSSPSRPGAGRNFSRLSPLTAAVGGGGYDNELAAESLPARPTLEASLFVAAQLPYTQWGGDTLTRLRQFSLGHRPQLSDVVGWLSTPGMMPERLSDDLVEEGPVSRLAPRTPVAPLPSEDTTSTWPLEVCSYTPFRLSEQLVSVVATDRYLAVIEEPLTDKAQRQHTIVRWIAIESLLSSDEGDDDGGGGLQGQGGESSTGWRVGVITFRCDRSHPPVVSVDDHRIILADPSTAGQMYVVDFCSATVRVVGLPMACRRGLGVVSVVPITWGWAARLSSPASSAPCNTEGSDLWCLTISTRNQREIIFIAEDGSVCRRFSVPCTGHIAAHPSAPLLVLASDNPDVLQHPLLQAIEGGIGTVIQFPEWRPVLVGGGGTCGGSRFSRTASSASSLRNDSLASVGGSSRGGGGEGANGGGIRPPLPAAPSPLWSLLDRKWVLLGLILCCIVVITVSLVWTSMTLLYSGWWLHMQNLVAQGDTALFGGAGGGVVAAPA